MSKNRFATLVAADDGLALDEVEAGAPVDISDLKSGTVNVTVVVTATCTAKVMVSGDGTNFVVAPGTNSFTASGVYAIVGAFKQARLDVTSVSGGSAIGYLSGETLSMAT